MTKTMTIEYRISGGVDLISAAAIRQYAAEGHDERWIASRLGCNAFLVEKVLRPQTEAAILQLYEVDKLAPRVIAAKLRLPFSRVRHVLKAAEARKAADRTSQNERSPE